MTSADSFSSPATGSSASASGSFASTASSPALGVRVTWVILRRELVRFLRQPARIGAAIGTPVILWLFMSSGFAGSFGRGGNGIIENGAAPSAVRDAMGENYTLFLLPGMMTLIAMFTAIFASISIIEDRQEGWLQSVLVSPAPRWSIAAGKMLGGAAIAFAQSILLLLALPIIGEWPGWLAVGATAAALAVTCIAMTGVGVAFAWVSESSQGFHAVMNLVLMPLWLLSGAFFSTASAAGWLAVVMYLNPLRWATEAIRRPIALGLTSPVGGTGETPQNISGAGSNADTIAEWLNHPAWWLSMAVACAFAVASFGIATAIVARRRKTG